MGGTVVQHKSKLRLATVIDKVYHQKFRWLFPFPLAESCKDPLPQADQSFCCQAYHKQAMRLHPDKGGDPDDFKELQRAFEVRQR